MADLYPIRIPAQGIRDIQKQGRLNRPMPQATGLGTNPCQEIFLPARGIGKTQSYKNYYLEFMQEFSFQREQRDSDIVDKMQQFLTTLRDKEMNKQVYEYVAYYVAPKDAKEGDVDTIILNDKLIASSDQEARTKVIRLIPTTWDAKIADVVIQVRAFR